jgi:hypothetical protein
LFSVIFFLPSASLHHQVLLIQRRSNFSVFHLEANALIHYYEYVQL